VALHVRARHEKVYAELKGGFAFDCLPSRRYAANSAWQMLSVLAFNLMRSMQVATTSERRTPNRKRRTLFRFASIQTRRRGRGEAGRQSHTRRREHAQGRLGISHTSLRNWPRRPDSLSDWGQTS